MRRDESSWVYGTGSLALLLIRGLLLFIVVPLSLLAWLGAAPFMAAPRPSFGQWLGWVDLNLTAALQRSMLRPFFQIPIEWVPKARLRTVEHRVNLLDFW